MTCCVYSFDGICPCLDDERWRCERWRCEAKIWFKELVLTTLLQHTIIGYEDNVANNPLTMNIVVSSIILTKDCKEIS